MISGKKNKPAKFLIAPCGINCSLCRAYLREKKPCRGCRGDDSFKSISCMRCPIKNCDRIKNRGISYCFRCSDFPCFYILRLEKRYSTKYGVSVVGNLSYIMRNGIKKFIRKQNEEWSCARCGALLCMHLPDCSSCGNAWYERVKPEERRKF